jgi:hypothetical protein
MRLRPLRKPISLPLVQQLEGVALTRFADEALLAGAQVVSEGMVGDPVDGDERTYAGSTLVTIPLDRIEIAGAVDRAGAGRLLEAARHSIGLHVRLIRLARLEAERRSAPRLPRDMEVELEFAVDDRNLLVDISVECTLAEPLTDVESAEEDEP